MFSFVKKEDICNKYLIILDNNCIVLKQLKNNYIIIVIKSLYKYIIMDDIYLDTINFNNEKLLKNILEWRNNYETRQNSLHNLYITNEIFNNIIEKYKKSDYKPLIIYQINEQNIQNNIPVGIITFIYENNNYYIGININPSFRNKNIASKALNKLINTSIIKDIIYAKIKKNNMYSIKLFSKFFTLSYTDDNFIYYYYDFSNKNQVISSNGKLESR